MGSSHWTLCLQPFHCSTGENVHSCFLQDILHNLWGNFPHKHPHLCNGHGVCHGQGGVHPLPFHCDGGGKLARGPVHHLCNTWTKWWLAQHGATRDQGQKVARDAGGHGGREGEDRNSVVLT